MTAPALAACVLTSCVLAGCGRSPGDVAPPVVPAREAGTGSGATGPMPRAAANLRDYAREVAALNGAVDAAVRQATQQPDNAQMALAAVALYLERTRLTGNYDDFRRAQALLDTQQGRPGAAPMTCLTQARLSFTLHRLADAGAALDACAGTLDPAEGAALRADIAFYSGRYKEAEATYRALVNQVGGATDYLRLALLRSRTGAPGEAAALLEAAEKRSHGASATTRAWLKLQRGLLAFERGRLDEALALYHLAADELPGWWLVEEHMAEVRLLAGDTAAARAMYENIVTGTGMPEFMDQLARLLHESGKPQAADAWIERARGLHRERLKSFPEAGLGHAVQHFLLFGSPAEALELARSNARLRPFGEAQIALAAALYRAGQAGAAATLIAQVQSSGWDTAQLHAVAAQIHAGLGRRAEADAQRARALAMNPHALRLYQIAPPVRPERVSLAPSVPRIV